LISKDAILVRRYDATTDEAFIYATWLRNYKSSSYFAKRIRHAVFFSGHKKVIEFILAKPQTTTLIAHPKDDPNTMLGYLVCEMVEKPTVHFTFVKEAFRKMGILRRLMEAAEIADPTFTFTHWTFPVDELIGKYPDLVYNPYAF
jgi:hypothetical protein